MARYTIIVEAERPPQITLGQQIGGAIVKELKKSKWSWFLLRTGSKTTYL